MPDHRKDNRLAALWRFATAITAFNVLGHTWFGFEQSWATPFLSLATAYATELLLEWVDSQVTGRQPRFLAKGIKSKIEFLLPAHITALAISMLLYPNARLLGFVFANVVAVSSKYLFRVEVGGRLRHFLNPSNFGITVTLLVFHWVGIAPPYMFTENLHPYGDWLLPLFLVCIGSFLNTVFTKRIPLVLAWLGTFALQGFVRNWIVGSPFPSTLLPMSGMAFLLFTFYMVSDPSTTPVNVRRQVLFGSSVALTYGLLLMAHVVFTLFFSLTIVCTLRGLSLYLAPYLARTRQRAKAVAPVAGPASAPVFSEGVES
jgi:Na+-translocating ferredoxin:NAD+ oxidoreductase RnfD subunit